MQKLNLPEYSFRIRKKDNKTEIFDPVRKKYFVLTPEEWVRQNMISFLNNEKKIPYSLMSVEKRVSINTQPQRFDLLIYNRSGNPVLIGEFKSPQIKITQVVFDQVVRYNMVFKVPYILVSNGLQHYICLVDLKKREYKFLKDIPEFSDLILA